MNRALAVMLDNCIRRSVGQALKRGCRFGIAGGTVRR
jgi:hypothetical protein